MEIDIKHCNNIDSAKILKGRGQTKHQVCSKWNWKKHNS